MCRSAKVLKRVVSRSTKTKQTVSIYILYGGDYTRALITQMVMAEGGIDYELRKVDILNDEHRSAAFLKINPAGFVPALITPEGEALHETPAINLYLADRHRLHHLAPAPSDPDRGRFLSALFDISGELEPAIKRYFYPHRYVINAANTDAMKRKAFEQAIQRLEVIEHRLSVEGPFHLGSRFSLVDLTLVYWVSSLNDVLNVLDFPAVKKCVEHAMNRPAILHMNGEVRSMIRRYKQLQSQREGVQ
jgi:glutathione S-transferase